LLLYDTTSAAVPDFGRFQSRHSGARVKRANPES
jgi:hypothetical protein